MGEISYSWSLDGGACRAQNERRSGHHQLPLLTGAGEAGFRLFVVEPWSSVVRARRTIGSTLPFDEGRGAWVPQQEAGQQLARGGYAHGHSDLAATCAGE